jgi:hypothetical protein
VKAGMWIVKAGMWLNVVEHLSSKCKAQDCQNQVLLKLLQV